MKSKLKVVNLDISGKKISAYTKVIQIDPTSPTNAVTITEQVVEPAIIDTETEEVQFDGFIHWFYGIVGTYVGGLAGEAMTMQDSLVVQVAEVDNYVYAPLGATEFVGYASVVYAPLGATEFVGYASVVYAPLGATEFTA